MTKINEPTIKKLEEREVAYVSFKGNYVKNPDVFKRLFDKLCSWAGPKGLMNDESVFLASYADNPKVTLPEELRLDLCLGISEDDEVDGDVMKKTLPGGTYVVMHAELTTTEEYGPVWEKIVAWAQEHDYAVDMSRPSYEIYLNNPEEHPQKHHIIDACLSVKAK